MIFNYDEYQRRLTITFEGEIDHHSCNLIKKESDYEIQRYSPKKLIFDFKNVKFMDSSGIGLLLGRYKQMLRFGGETIMININNDIKRIFDMSGIFKIIPLVEGVESI